MSKVFWSIYFRVPACALVFAAGYFASLYFPIISEWSNAKLVRDILSEVSSGHFDKVVSDEHFAYALACMIVSIATGIALVVLIMDVLYIRLSLWIAGRPIAKMNSRNAFKEQFETIRGSVSKSALVGRAWDDYVRVCVNDPQKPAEPVRVLVRSQTVFGASIARERVYGLKLLPTIPDAVTLRLHRQPPGRDHDADRIRVRLHARQP